MAFIDTMGRISLFLCIFLISLRALEKLAINNIIKNDGFLVIGKKKILFMGNKKYRR